MCSRQRKFDLMSVNHSAIVFFSIFFTMNVCYVFSLESPHRGDSNEYTQHTIINIKTKITLNYPRYNYVCSYRICSYGLKKEFETAVVNEPSVFEPLKFYCILVLILTLSSQTSHYIWNCITQPVYAQGASLMKGFCQTLNHIS